MALTSPFALLFNKLITRLEAQVPAIRYINQDWAQLDHATPPISYPAVLIDFSESSFAQYQGFQKAAVTVTLKLIYRSFTDTGNLPPDGVRENALQFYELEWDIYKALQAWYADGLLCDALIRSRATTDKRDDGLRVRVLEFSAAYHDDAVMG